jgi:hypothetical protein
MERSWVMSGGAPIRRRRLDGVPLETWVLVQDWRIEDDTVRPTASWLSVPDRLVF